METVKTNESAPVAPVAPVTLDSLKATKKATEAALAAIMMNDEASDDEKNKAVIAQQKAKKALNDFIAAGEAAKKAEELETAKSAKVAMLQNLLDLHLVNVAIQKDTKKPIDERNKSNDEFKAKFAEIAELLKKTVTLHIPMGMSGKTLEKKVSSDKPVVASDGTNKRQTIFGLLDEGKSKDEIEQITGFSRKEISDNEWHWKKKNA